MRFILFFVILLIPALSYSSDVSMILPMNSNNSNGQIVSSSTAGSAPYMAFDKIIDGSIGYFQSTSLPAWLQIDLPLNTLVPTSYSIIGYGGGAPDSWVLQGYCLSTWKTLDSRSGIIWTPYVSGTVRSFTLPDSNTSCTSFKLTMMYPTNSTRTDLVIQEFDIFGRSPLPFALVGKISLEDYRFYMGLSGIFSALCIALVWSRGL